MPQRVPISELIDVDSLRENGRPSTPRHIRAALPRGWVLDEDNEHATRDARLFFREAWILLVGLVVFGSVGLTFLWGAVPRGWSGVFRLLVLVAVVLLVGGLIAPLITRALNRR